jgi:CheY-like chemotaxis protein/HPt (histidine-containing phosphotransfer) domain-containing protein
MGGECGASSRLGVGSVFWFTITVKTGATPARFESSPPPAGLGGLTALVVDHSASQRAVLSAHLTGWGMTVTTTSSGLEARAALQQAASTEQPFSVALIDRLLLAATGPELTAAVATRVVVMSRSGDGRSTSDVLAPPGSSHLSKPIHQSRLLRCLERALRSSEELTPPDESVGRRPSPLSLSPGALLLVAEDNLVNQKVVVALLTNGGYSVDLAPDGEQAVRSSAAVRYDAIVMDCQMPVMDGYQATRAIRTAEGRERHTPIIALTAGAMIGEQERCVAAGMDDYLTKPIDREKLLATLARWISLAQQPRESDLEMTPAPIGTSPTDLPDATVLDAGLIAELVDLDHGSVGLLTELVSLFRSTVDGHLDQLDASIAAADAPATRSAAHAISGASASIGAITVASLARELEHLASEARLDAAPSLAASVRASVLQALAALDGEIARVADATSPPATAVGAS